MAEPGTVQSNNRDCMSCRMIGTVTFAMVGAFFFGCCKHVKPVYYAGTPSMIYLAVARAFDLKPFRDQPRV